jgi:hypothetical protein
MRNNTVNLSVITVACAGLMALALSSCAAIGLGHEYRGQYVSNILLDPPNPGPGQRVKITVPEIYDLNPNYAYPMWDMNPDVSVSAGELYYVHAYGSSLAADWGSFDSATLAAHQDRYAELAPFSVGTLANYAETLGNDPYLIWRAPDSAQQVTIMAGYFYGQTPSEPGKNGCALTLDVL